MSTLAQRVIEDLKAFSADLLDRGFSEADESAAAARAAQLRNSGGTQSAILSMVGSLTMLTPRLLAELEHISVTTDLRVTSTRSPRRARISRRPSDFACDGERLIPIRWEGLVPSGRLEARPLRWLLHLMQRQRDSLKENTERVAKSVAEARASRQGHSVWAEADARTLEGLLDRLQRAELSLARSEHHVRRALPFRIMPLAQRPDPYPASPAWSSLRRLAARVERPEDFLPEYLQTLWGSVTESAQLSHLYERWVGMRIIESLNALGWTLRQDPVGAIFLGGQLAFYRGKTRFDLWVQPRLTRSGNHPSHWIASRGEEVSPDYLFVTPGPGGPSAFVLDATLRTTEDAHREKARYGWLIQYGHLVRVGGATCSRAPDLAWAAAPILSSHNKTFDNRGSNGVVPMHPLNWNPTGLEQWLDWVARHATAWSHSYQPRHRTRRGPPKTTVSGPLMVRAQRPDSESP